MSISKKNFKKIKDIIKDDIQVQRKYDESEILQIVNNLIDIIKKINDNEFKIDISNSDLVKNYILQYVYFYQKDNKYFLNFKKKNSKNKENQSKFINETADNTSTDQNKLIGDTVKIIELNINQISQENKSIEIL